MVSLEFPKLENACHCNFGLLKIGLKFQIGKKNQCLKITEKVPGKFKLKFFSNGFTRISKSLKCMSLQLWTSKILRVDRYGWKTVGIPQWYVCMPILFKYCLTGHAP